MRGVFSGYRLTLENFRSWRFNAAIIFAVFGTIVSIQYYDLHHKLLSTHQSVYEFQHWALESLHYTSPESTLFLYMSCVMVITAMALPKKKTCLKQA